MIGKHNNEKAKIGEMKHIQEKDNKAPEKEGDTSVCLVSRALSGAISDRHALSRETRRKNIILRFLIICFRIPI